ALGDLFSGPAGLWTVAGSVAQPLFQGGRIKNRVKFAEARTQETTLQYQQTVQQALRDVSDSLVRYQKSQQVRAELEQLSTTAQEAQRLSNMRYKGGRASYLEVLDSDTRYFTAQISLAQSQLNELEALVQIYRSLGGGWQ